MSLGYAKDKQFKAQLSQYNETENFGPTGECLNYNY